MDDQTQEIAPVAIPKLSLEKQSSFMEKAGSEEVKAMQEAAAEEKKREEEPEDKFSQTFQGKLKTIINFKDKDDQTGSKEVQDTFSDILLNVSSGKDFYAVWDSEYTTTIENFAKEEGVYVQAEKVDWIQQLPSVLTF